MSEKPAGQRRIRPPNWSFFDQRADESDVESMTYAAGSVANQEAVAIRSLLSTAGRGLIRCLRAMLRDAVLSAAAAALLALPQSASAQSAEHRWEQMRRRMVRQQIEARGIQSAAVLDALRSVPREHFVPAEVREFATDDTALPIGYEQTISQPYIVAFMTELLELERHHKVLEIGTGSGYQTAVLASLSDSVHSIEIVPELAARALRALAELGYAHAKVEQGDGYQGWAEHAPFDRIIVTAAPTEIPKALVQQLAADGRMVVPVGPTHGTQSLTLVTKDARGKLRRQRRLAVRFVPMVRVTDRN